MSHLFHSDDRIVSSDVEFGEQVVEFLKLNFREKIDAAVYHYIVKLLRFHKDQNTDL